MTTPVSPARAAVLNAIADEALRGRSTLLVAPSGAGRSLALQRITETVHRRQPAVRRFTASSGTASTPFGLFLGVLDAAGTRRLSALDGLGRTALLRAAVLELGLRVAVVDEAPLVDADSAALLLELAQSGTAVVAGATAGRVLPDAVRTLFAAPEAATATLPALDLDEIAVMAAEVLGGPADRELIGAVEQAGNGLPASTAELLREGRATGAFQRVEGLWVLVGELPPLASAQRRIAERWPALQPAQQAWLAQVAMAGTVADDLAEQLATDHVADWAERAGWTVHRAGRTAIRSPGVRGGVLQQLGARARAAAARRLLQALLGAGRPLSRAERLAEVHCRVELGDGVDVERARAVAQEFGLAEDGPAERLLRDAVAHDGTAAAHGALAEQLARAGRLEAARSAIEAVEEQDARRLRAALLGYGDHDPDSALTLLGEPEDDEGIAMRIGLLRLAGRTTASAKAAAALRRRSTGPTAALANLHEGLALLDRADADGVLGAVERLHADPGALRGLPGGGSSAAWLTGRVQVELRLDVDDRALLEQYEAARADPQPGARAPFGHLLGRVRLLRGDPRGAAQVLHEAVAAPGLWARGRAIALQADLASALALAGDLHGALEHLPRGSAAPAQQPRVLLAQASVAHARGDGAGAAGHAGRAAEVSAQWGRTLDQVDATYDALRYGDPGAAERLLALPAVDGAGRELQRRHAAAALTGSPEALERVAVDLHAAGLVLWAIEAASTALRLRAEAGAQSRAAVVRLAEWIAAATGLVLPVDQARRPSTLTAREREVAHLAASGLADRAVAERLGISVRTAQTHLARAFSKLGVHRRGELAEALGS